MRSPISPVSEPAATARRLFASELKNDGTDKPYPNLSPEEVPDPPGMFATIGAMGAGAGGAVLIAGVGVWAVFKLAFWVAGQTGRSLNGEGNKTKIDSPTALKGSNTTENTERSPKIASPLEKVAENTTLRWWRERCSGVGDGDNLSFKLASFYSNR